jgi:hypothetical protein
MKKVILSIILCMFIFFVSCSQNTTSNITTLNTTENQTSTIENTTSITTLLTDEPEYVNGVLINNNTNCNDLITLIIDNEDMIQNSLKLYTFDDVNNRYSIECLRRANEDILYSIHRTNQGTYLYFFYELFNYEWVVKYQCRFSKDISYNDLTSLLESNSTLDDIEILYPSIITITLSQDSSVRGLIVLLNGDAYSLMFGYAFDDINYLQEITSRGNIDEYGYFDKILEIDKPSILIPNNDDID